MTRLYYQHSQPKFTYSLAKAGFSKNFNVFSPCRNTNSRKFKWCNRIIQNRWSCWTPSLLQLVISKAKLIWSFSVLFAVPRPNHHWFFNHANVPKSLQARYFCKEWFSFQRSKTVAILATDSCINMETVGPWKIAGPFFEISLIFSTSRFLWRVQW